LVARLAALFAALSVLIPLHAAQALERTLARAPDREGEEWASAGTCTVRYYNICTGWIWVWSGWFDDERIGTVYDRCCQQAVLTLTSHLTFSGIPAGWGFTGTIGVYAADASDCPTGPPLAVRPWCPPVRSGWNTHAWSVAVPPAFVVQVAWGAPSQFTNSTGLASDRSAAGPTGPQPCGTCFPTSRTTRSYQFGAQGAPYCPGHRLSDGTCDVEWLIDGQLFCPVHTEDRSWGAIKSLYR
jgi:hypothetical protein